MYMYRMRVYLYAYLIPIILSARVRGSSVQRKAAQKKNELSYL